MNSLLIGIIVAMGFLTVVVLLVISAEKPEINIIQDNVEIKSGIEIPCSKDAHLNRTSFSEKDTKQGYVSGELIVVLRELSQGNGIPLHDRMAKIISNYDQVMIWESKLNPISGICVPENEEQKYADLLRANEDVKSVGLNAIGGIG